MKTNSICDHRRLLLLQAFDIIIRIEIDKTIVVITLVR